MDEPTRKVRFEIFRFILDKCRPPTTAELADSTGHSTAEVMDILKRLEDLHHLTLYNENVPSPTPISMVHPFSHL